MDPADGDGEGEGDGDRDGDGEGEARTACPASAGDPATSGMDTRIAIRGHGELRAIRSRAQESRLYGRGDFLLELGLRTSRHDPLDDEAGRKDGIRAL